MYFITVSVVYLPYKEQREDTGMTTRRAKIAIIEDDMAIAQMYRLKFEMEYEVETAANGRLGLELAEFMRPDIILLDLMMPEMNGEDMLEKLRAKPWGKRIKVVILTNKGEQEVPDKIWGLGVRAVILKADMTPRQVAEMIRNELASMELQ